MADNLVLYSDFECAGGVPLAVIGPVVSGTARRVTDNSDSLVVAVPDWAQCVGLVQFGHIVRRVDPLGTVTEWRVSQIDDAVGEGEGVTTITAEHAATIMADVALIADVTSGGGTAFNLGSAGGITPAEYLTAFVVPALQAVGIDWVGVGTVEFTDPLVRTFERATPLQLVQDLATELVCEVDFRRDGSTGYVIDLVAERNGALLPVLVKKGKNLRRISRSRRAVDLKTVYVPAGKVVDGAVEAANIGRMVGKVTAKSGNTVTIADPAGLVSLIAFDDQWNTRYLLAADLSLVQITDTLLSTQQLVLSSAAAVAVGDHVEIRADAQGTLLTEFSNPAAVAQYGRRVGSKANDKLRGERNHTRNPFLSSGWPGATVTATTGTFNFFGTPENPISVSDFPAGHAFAVGDRIAVGQNNHWYRVTGAATADGTGAASVPISGSVSAANGSAVLHLTAQETGPDDWDRTLSQAATNGYFATGPLRRRTEWAQRSGIVTSFTAYAGVGARVVLGNFAPSVYVPEGSNVELSTDAVTWVAAGSLLGEVTIAGDGTATIAYRGDGSGLSAGIHIRLTPPVLPTDAKGTPLLLWGQQTIDGTGPWVDTEEFSIKYDPSLTSLWVSASLTLWGSRGASASYLNGSDLAPRLDLLAPDDTSLASVIDADPDNTSRTLVGFTPQTVTLRAQFTMTGDLTARLRVRAPGGETTADSSILASVNWASVYLTSDPECPPVEGSHANQLLGWGQTQLKTLSADPALYEMDLRDVATEQGYDADTEALLLGRPVRAHDAPRALDDTRRIVATEEDLTGQTPPKLEVSARAPSSAQQVSAQKPKPVFVQVNVTETAGSVPVVRTVKSTDTPPPETPDAKRAEQTPEGDVVVTTYNPTGFVI